MAIVPADVGIEWARGLGEVPRARTERWVMIGQDGGQSIDLGDRSLFVFADTVISALPPDEPATPSHELVAGASAWFLANNAAFGSGPDLSAALSDLRYLCAEDGHPREILPATPAEQRARIRFWPAHGIAIDGVVHLFYVGVESLDWRDALGFRHLGVGLATLDPATGEACRVLRAGRWQHWSSTSDDLHLGVQVVAVGDDVYVFGSRRRGLTIEALLARVPTHQILEPAAYTYFQPATDRWSPSISAAGSLGPCGSDYSVTFNRHLDAYLMIYVDSFAKELLLRVAEDITGPYSAPQIIGRLPHRPASSVVYLAFEHPQFAEDDGATINLTYSEPYFALNSLARIRLSSSQAPVRRRRTEPV